MLHIMRKHSKSWGIKVVFGIIILVFIAWGGYAYHSLKDTAVAQIGDHLISRTEYETTYQNMAERYRQQLGRAFSEDLMKKLGLRQQALDALINSYLITKGADELGLSASTDEVRRYIMQFPGLLNEGKFDQARYEASLRQQRTTPEAFEKQIAQEITFKKAQAFIKDRAVVTEQEILDDYHFNRDQVKLAYIPFDPKSFEDQVKVQDDALQAFYQKNTNRYMDPEKREVVYVLLNTGEIGKEIPVSDADVKTYYDEHISQYTHEEEVHARHILFKLKPDATPEEVEKVRAEAQKALDEAKKNKNFPELAKKYSQDEGSAQNGGDLSYFSKKQMQPAFAEAAFALKPGEISGLVQTPFGFHIIKVEDVRAARTSPLEEVKADIKKTLQTEKAQDIAFNRSRDLRDMAYARKDLEKAAQELKLSAPATTWVEMGQEQSESGVFPSQAKMKLFGMGQGDISEVLETPKGLAVAQLKTIKPPQAIPLEQVKDKVVKDYKADQAKVLARQKADEVLKAAKEKNNLEEVAAQMKLSVRQSDFFSRENPDKDLKLLRGDNLGQIFDLTESRPFPSSSLELGNRYMVCRLVAKTAAPQPSPEELASISKQLLQEKQEAVWEAWVMDLRKNTKMEQLKQI